MKAERRGEAADATSGDEDVVQGNQPVSLSIWGLASITACRCSACNSPVGRAD
jgi:hypothetical protein